MFAIERQQSILKLLAENGKVTITELVALFDTSHETIRKDLVQLAHQNALRRIYGGAVRVETYYDLQPLSARKTERIAQKSELCRYAAGLIREEDVIAIDEGSTAVEFAKIIAARFSNLTVLTHNLEVFHILSENSRFSIVLCGGKFIREENAFAGHFAAEIANQMHTRKAFICPAAISLHYGITDYGEEFIPIQKNYIANTDNVIMLADSQKFEASAKYKICDMAPHITLVTDSQLKDHIFDAYKKQEINVIRSSQ